MKNQLIFLAKTKKKHEELSKAPWSGNEEHRKPDTVPSYRQKPSHCIIILHSSPTIYRNNIKFRWRCGRPVCVANAFFRDECVSPLLMYETVSHICVCVLFFDFCGGGVVQAGPAA